MGKEDEPMETAPNSDGHTTGDKSFDSLDGLFPENGAEFDELLKTLNEA